MVDLIDQRFPFSNPCFVGGASTEDVRRIRIESKAELRNRKTVKTKTTSTPHVPDGFDADWLASIVREKLKEDTMHLLTNISTLQESFNGFKTTVLTTLKDVCGKLEENASKLASLSADICNMSAMGLTAPNSQANPPTGSPSQQTDVANIISQAMQFGNRESNSIASVSQYLNV